MSRNKETARCIDSHPFGDTSDSWSSARRLPAAELDSARHVIKADMAVFDLGPTDSQ